MKSWRPLGCVAFVVVASAGTAFAQNRPRPAIEIPAGWIGFPDDALVSETMIGGAARWHLLPRVSVGPEMVYIMGETHSHLVVTGNVTLDLRAPMDGRGYLMPFVVVGGGLFQTRESFSLGDFTSNEGAFTAGGGLRTSVSDRMTAGVDVRVGWETHVRINGFLGVRLGR